MAQSGKVVEEIQEYRPNWGGNIDKRDGRVNERFLLE
jgi:hypothetical protein